MGRILRRVDRLAQRTVGDETVVLDLDRSWVHGLNPSGGRLLDLLRQPTTDRALRSWAEAAGGAEAVAEVDDFLVALGRLGLVEEPAEPGAERNLERLEGAWAPPRVVWSEPVARVTNQTSPPQIITVPQCQP